MVGFNPTRASHWLHNSAQRRRFAPPGDNETLRKAGSHVFNRALLPYVSSFVREPAHSSIKKPYLALNGLLCLLQQAFLSSIYQPRVLRDIDLYFSSQTLLYPTYTPAHITTAQHGFTFVCSAQPIWRH